MSMKENAGFWDHRSLIFDEHVGSIYRQAYQKTIDGAMKYINKEARVLEFGCGTGITTLPIAVGAGSVTAVDTSPMMLEQAREKAKSGGADNIEFLEGDLSLRELKPESFDVVTAFNVLLYLPDQDGAMKRIRELLKPGGILAAAADCLKYSLTREALSKWLRSRTGRMPYVKFYTPGELEALAVRHGMRLLEAETLFKRPVNYFFAAQKED